MRKTLSHFLCLLAFASGALWGQAVSGTLSGRVTAPAGTGVPNAAVTITNTETNVSQRVLTGPDGSFSVAGLPPGTYRVDVETAGFKRTSQQDIQLSTTGPATVSITLEPGSMQETVEIKGTAPNIQTQDGEVSLGLPTRTVRERPIIDRNHQDLVNMMTGTTPPEATMPRVLDPPHNRFFSTNGQGTNLNLWHIDGTNNYEAFRGTAVRVQPVESMQVMNMVAANPSAEKGFAGGMIVHNITRGGTNDWHGSLFEFHSNNKLRSREFFNQPGNPKPRFTWNQFGGTVGGRIIPDKFFFFGSYEGTYNRGQSTHITTVPTPDMIGGNFGAVPGLQLFNPNTGTAAGLGRTPFFGNVIPSGQINPNSAALAAQLPSPNLPGFTNNFIANTPYENDWQKADGRLDYRFSDRTSAFLRYGYSNLHALEASPFGSLGVNGRDRLLGHNAVANVTHSFTPSFLTEFRFGYSRYDQNLNFINSGFNGFAAGLPSINIAGMLPLGSPLNMPMNAVDNNFNWVWNWSWRSGMHNVKFGTDIRRFRADGFYNNLAFNQLGAAYFGPGATLSPATTGFSSLGTFANSFASFLVGAPSMTGAAAFTETPTIRQSWYSLYVSDTLQPLRRFNVDVGVRYDVFSPLEPRRAGGAMFYDPDFNTLNFAGTGDTGMKRTRWDTNNVSPRISFAYSPNDKTAVRGGYSISYFQVPYAQTGWMPTMVATSAGLTGTFATAPGGFGPGLAPPAFTGSLANGVVAPNIPLTVVPRDLKTPYIQSYSLQVQHEFVSNLVLNVGYVGTLGRQLPYVQELNAATPGTGVAGLPFAGFGRTASTLLYARGVNNNYNSLQVNLSKRFSHGLAFQGAYTWGRALGYTTGEDNMLLNPFDRAANYGPLDYDRQHHLTLTHLWELPFGAGTNRWNEGIIGQLIGNWQINGVFSWATGTPLTVTADPLFCNCPNVTPVANVTGQVNTVDRFGLGQTFFNTGAFSAPGPGQLGNLGRGAFRGPDFKNYDMSIFRSFPFRDQYKLEFRGEVYNISNTPRFVNPVTSLNSPTFGQVNSTYNGAFGRQFNLALRFLF